MKNLMQLVKAESEGVRQKIVVSTAVAGLSQAAILAIINQAAQTASYDGLNMRYLLMFIVALILYVICQRFSSSEMIRITTEIVEKIRLRIGEKIQRSELPVLERIGKAPILNAMSHEASIISDCGDTLISGLQAAIFVFFAFLYIFVLSRPAFFMTLIFAALAIAIVQRNRAEASRLALATKAKEIEFLNYVTHAIDGFKETKINERKRNDLEQDLRHTAHEVKELLEKTDNLFYRNFVVAQCCLYGMIAIVVFVLPTLIETYSEVITEITMAILFIVGPLTLIVGLIPYIAKCDEAASAVARLEEALDEGHTAIGSQKHVLPIPTSPKTISFHEVVFKYRSETNESFTLGPLSFSVNVPEILFIIGGNGSGKSTLLKVFTGLYLPDSGTIDVDGVAVGPANIQGYRELFSAIFADFHLFEKLYGMFGTSNLAVMDLLKQMHLDRKVQFTQEGFTTLDLSTGQKKRLALVVSLLEQKNTYVFDELAADQDPEFRRFLYEELLPALKKRGHGVVAATHDDRYFHVADRIMKMEYGKIEYIRPNS